MSEYKKYLSPFSWRYGSPEMRKIWSEVHKRKLWRLLWVFLAETQLEFGLTRPEQVEELRHRMEDIDIDRSLEIESQIHHDLMAEIKTYAEQCPNGGGIIHLGATSVDIKDNATTLQIKESLIRIEHQISTLLISLANKTLQYADTPIIAFTHLQPAEPSTLGYRIAQYTQDVYNDWENIIRVRHQLKGKGFKGAVGTSASFADLLGQENLTRFETLLSDRIGLEFYPVSTQTYPRQQDYFVLSGLAGLGASLNKLAFDVRILQSPLIGEAAEPFGEFQVGSSAMPFKRNPINAEKINSLARSLAQFPRIAWDNAAFSLLERTMDDSANRRTILPEAFLLADELLQVATRLVDHIIIDENAIIRNLDKFGPFAATERILMALSKAGANRQEMHERLRKHSIEAWEAIRSENPNPLAELIATDPKIQNYLNQDQIKNLMNCSRYLGDASQKAKTLANFIHHQVGKQVK